MFRWVKIEAGDKVHIGMLTRFVFLGIVDIQIAYVANA